MLRLKNPYNKPYFIYLASYFSGLTEAQQESLIKDCAENSKLLVLLQKNDAVFVVEDKDTLEFYTADTTKKELRKCVIGKIEIMYLLGKALLEQEYKQHYYTAVEKDCIRAYFVQKYSVLWQQLEFTFAEDTLIVRQEYKGSFLETERIFFKKIARRRK